MRRTTPDDALLIDAYRLTDGERAWRFEPNSTYGEGLQQVLPLVVGTRVLVSDHRAQIHLLDGSSGDVLQTFSLSDRFSHFCRTDDTTYVVSTDQQRWRFDTTIDALVLDDNRGALSCHSRGSRHPLPDHLFAREWAIRGIGERPKVEGGENTRWARSFEQRDRLWVFGYRHPGTPVPRVARLEPETGRTIWMRDVVEGSVLDAGRHSPVAVSDRARVYVLHFGADGESHLSALEGEDGTRAWSTPTAERVRMSVDLEMLAVVADALVLLISGELIVYDAGTGTERFSLRKR